MKARLEANGVSVVGITDHGFVKSIYFFDPNGIRLEFTAETADQETSCRNTPAPHTRRSRRGTRKRRAAREPDSVRHPAAARVCAGRSSS